MTRKDVTIAVRTVSDTGSIDELILSYETEGKYWFNNDGAELWYDEPEHLGMGNVRTRFHIYAGKAVIVREGDVNSEMRLIPGENTDFVYSVSAGNITLFVRTEQLKSTLSDSGGTVSFSYEIFNGEEKLSENEIILEIREV